MKKVMKNFKSFPSKILNTSHFVVKHYATVGTTVSAAIVPRKTSNTRHPFCSNMLSWQNFGMKFHPVSMAVNRLELTIRYKKDAVLQSALPPSLARIG